MKRVWASLRKFSKVTVLLLGAAFLSGCHALHYGVSHHSYSYAPVKPYYGYGQ